VGVLDLFLAVLARAKAGDQVHGTGTVQRHQGDDVLEHAGLGVAQHALHAAAFELEHGHRLALRQQVEGGTVVQGDARKIEIDLLGVAADDEFPGLLQDGQRGQAQEVELH
jgi:hypothetical protein